MSGWSEAAMARRAAADIPMGAIVNLGIGLPEQVADHLSPEHGVLFHSENGLLGMGPRPNAEDEDDDLINAGKKPVTIVPGASFFHHADSFAMIRGGHIDIAIMGAFEVSAVGDLANWSAGGGIPAVGGAMDLAVGARRVHVMMRHLGRDGAPKLVERCTLPVTGRGVVARVYTDFAVIDCGPDGFRLIEAAPGVDRARVEAATGAPLR